eukprot:6624151-Prymnesium_polylepis.1
MVYRCYAVLGDDEACQEERTRGKLMCPTCTADGRELPAELGCWSAASSGARRLAPSPPSSGIVSGERVRSMSPRTRTRGTAFWRRSTATRPRTKPWPSSTRTPTRTAPATLDAKRCGGRRIRTPSRTSRRHMT